MLPRDADLQAYAAHCLGELLDNGLQHANASTPTVGSARSGATTRKGQLAVADCGVGLRRSLARNPGLQVDTDIQAIALAFTPWTSGTGGQDVGMYGRQENTGNGLTMVRKLTELVGGELLLASGWALLHVTPDDVVPHRLGVWPGTVVAVEFPLELPESFETLKRTALQALGPRPDTRRRGRGR
jgi:hypothetical protein